MLWWKNIFWSASQKWHENIWQKITIGQGDDKTTGCLLDYNSFDEHYQMIVVDLSKQKALEADPKTI